MKIGNTPLAYGLCLAPMAGFTDEPMRALCRRLGAEYTVTEMVSAAAICYGDRKTAALARLTARDAPCAVQLFGHDCAQMTAAVRKIASGEYPGCTSERRPAAIDLNMGCPVKKIVSAGDGSALMRSPALCAALVDAAVTAAAPYGIPVTVKIRAGWDSSSRNAADVARAAVNMGAQAVCVHARTREEMYAPGADWSVIARVRDALPPEIPVIGNGDVACAEDFLRMKQECGCDGVAVGREALGNPWVFEEIRCALAGRPFTPPAEQERRMTALALAAEIVENAGEGAVRECRGRIGHFLKGMRGAALLRGRLNGAQSMAELTEILTGAPEQDFCTGM